MITVVKMIVMVMMMTDDGDEDNVNDENKNKHVEKDDRDNADTIQDYDTKSADNSTTVLHADNFQRG